LNKTYFSLVVLAALVVSFDAQAGGKIKYRSLTPSEQQDMLSFRVVSPSPSSVSSEGSERDTPVTSVDSLELGRFDFSPKALAAVEAFERGQGHKGNRFSTSPTSWEEPISSRTERQCKDRRGKEAAAKHKNKWSRK